jgi:hypothetical protein
MAKLVSLTLTVTGGAAAKVSADALVDALDRLGNDRAGPFRHRLMTLYESGDLFVAEPACRSAGGAAILNGLQLEPSDRYRELVAAIADECDDVSIRVTHGWPILSDSSAVSLAELAVESIPLAGA